MSGAKTLSTSETKIEALSLQSSAYGVTIPMVWGVNRIAGNMVWYGGFKAVPHTSTTGGKGGGAKTQSTSYTYTASVMMGLCEGQIASITRAWKGKKLFTGGFASSQLLSTIESYTVPAGGGAYTVAHATTFATHSSVTMNSRFYLSEGRDFTRVGGAYTFPASMGGRSLVISYQWGNGGAQTALQAMGLSFMSGALGQPAWSYLTSNYPAQAIGYSGLAGVYAQDYDLGASAQVDNHSFEIQGPQAYSISTTIPDANPALVTFDALANDRRERRPVNLLEQRAAQRRLAGADIARDDDESFAPADGVLQQVERVAVRLAAIEIFRIRRQAERLLRKSVVALVHVIGPPRRR